MDARVALRQKNKMPRPTLIQKRYEADAEYERLAKESEAVLATVKADAE